ncbi:MAG: GDP-mannose 4,6-dehydratase [Pseudomonadota bacterium]
MTTVWITGVNGFTGQHLVRYLAARPEKLSLVGLGRAQEPAIKLDHYYSLDITQVDAVREAARKTPPAIVIHAAAAMPPASDAEMWHVHAGGVVGLMRGLAAAAIGDVRVLNIGSAAEYLKSASGFLRESDPCGGENTYGRSKWAQTVLAQELGRQFKIPVMVARTFNLLGPGLPNKWVAASLCAQFAQTDPSEVKVGNTKSERDFLDIRDAVAAYWAIATSGQPGESYNVCTGAPTSIEELLRVCSQMSGGIHTIKVDEARFRNVDLDRVYGDSSKLRSELGWAPRISFSDSLAEMFAEARK